MHLLLTGAWQSAKENIARLEQMGHEVQFLQMERDALPCDEAWVEGVVCNGLFLYHDIEKFSNLRYIQLTSVGLDRVPMDYITAHGIEIHNAKGIYCVPMAEFVLAGVLALYKDMPTFWDNQKEHRWAKNSGLLEFAGKTVCIVGCGDIGRECAKRFAAFDCRVLGVNRTVRDVPCMDKVYPLTALDEVLPLADIVALAIPAVPETYHLMNDERLERMKPGAILVNVARGAVLDTQALIRHADRLGGAVIDVFEQEPLLEDSPLWSLPNFIITPHNSFASEQNQGRLFRIILDNLKRVKI